MRFRDAKKLHTEDEVTLKKTKEMGRILSTEIIGDRVIFELVVNGLYFVKDHREVS